tara:strand:+ start:342 stop:866 length:525 start_codon:yes stop_codon:yes gene_type:complete
MLNLNQQCSKHFIFRDLIECGETWKKHSNSIDNLPKEQNTFTSIRLLCEQILDPVADHFAKITLTYGFASSNLTQLIKRRIYPALDQQAGYEKKRNGQYICPRLGQAVDFYIPKISSKEIGQWIIQHTSFDRLYFYGNNKSLHVSVGPENKQQIVKMTQSTNTNRLVPKVVSNL